MEDKNPDSADDSKAKPPLFQGGMQGVEQAICPLVGMKCSEFNPDGKRNCDWYVPIKVANIHLVGSITDAMACKIDVLLQSAMSTSVLIREILAAVQSKGQEPIFKLPGGM